MKLALRVIVFISFVISANAQKGAIVIKDENGDPLQGVYVTDVNNPSKFGVTTNSKFELRDEGYGELLRLERFGYKDITVTADISKGSTVTMEREVYPNNLFYYHPIDGLKSGFRTNEYEVFGNFDTYTENGVTSSTSGTDETRMFIDDNQDAFGSGKALRVRYPKGKYDSKPSGAQWRGRLSEEAEELYVSYWVKFESGFDFTLGGKLPGLAGSSDYLSGENEFSGKLMWRKNGALEFYLHPTEAGVDGGDSDAGKVRGWWGSNEANAARLRTGQWEHIEIYYKLNTPGQANGEMKGWLNGVQKGQKNNVEFRGAGQSGVKLNQLFFSTFFGGNQDYAPNSDQYAWFDDFRVSETRIGKPNAPIDLVTGNNHSDLNASDIVKVGENVYQLIEGAHWVLINTLGQVVAEGESRIVDVSELPYGQYFLRHEQGSYRVMKTSF